MGVVLLETRLRHAETLPDEYRGGGHVDADNYIVRAVQRQAPLTAPEVCNTVERILRPFVELALLAFVDL
jgi:hypothetical protein